MELIKQQLNDKMTDISSYEEELEKLLTILESRVQFILLNLVRLISSLKKRLVVEHRTISLVQRFSSLNITKVCQEIREP